MMPKGECPRRTARFISGVLAGAADKEDEDSDRHSRKAMRDED